MSQAPLIFCALDTADLNQATQWAKTIGPVTKGLKVGMEFVNTFGPQGIEAVQNACPEAQLFIDLKFYDIPNTVAGAVRTICINFAPAYLNVHASGGETMMRAAKDACDDASNGKSKLLAVTILTSLDYNELCKIGYVGNSEVDSVVRLAKLTQDCGLDGVVCSALEIEMLRRECGADFTLMVPGIRPAGADRQDQKRVMTPPEAIQNGATHLVIGRPITAAPDPAQAAQQILESVS